jgi:hypothetical protein
MAPTLDFTQFRAEDGSNTKRRIQGLYNGPASYVTGGDPFFPQDIKLGQIDLLHLNDAVLAGTNTLYTAVWLPGTDPATTGKIMWFVGSTGVEVAGAVNLSTAVIRFEAIGR